LAWLAVRIALQQAGSHYIGLGAGKYSPLAYAFQLLDGPGSLLMFDRNGANIIAIILLLLAVVVMMRDRKAVALRFSASIVAISLAVLYVLFNLTWIFNVLGSNRFILFAPLLLGPVAYVTALSLKPRAATVVAILALVPQLYWTSRWVIGQQTSTLAELNFPNSFTPPQGYISPTYRSGPPIPTANGLLMAVNTEEEPKGRRQ